MIEEKLENNLRQSLNTKSVKPLRVAVQLVYGLTEPPQDLNDILGSCENRDFEFFPFSSSFSLTASPNEIEKLTDAPSVKMIRLLTESNVIHV